jgi:hypothetical protein
LNPPQDTLSFAQVIKMATLADFDVLHFPASDIQQRKWAHPNVREAMRLHFGLKRAREEIIRLNVELRQQVTFMWEQHVCYWEAVRSAQWHDNALTAYIALQGSYQDCIFTHIYRVLYKTSQLPGFTGSLLPGTRTGSNLTNFRPPWVEQGNQTLDGDEFADVENEDFGEGKVEENLVVELFEQLTTTE